jgi:hypothetical protein
LRRLPPRIRITVHESVETEYDLFIFPSDSNKWKQQVTDVTIEQLKNSMRTLLKESISAAIDASLPLDELRGVALFNPTRDERFISLDSFPTTVQMVATIPNFAARFGNDNSTRLVLQFVYEYFYCIDTIQFDEVKFEALWQDFLFELIEEPDWIYRAVSNLRCFRTERPPLQVLDLGDGVTIRGRSFAELKSLGFDDPIWDQIAEDWRSGFGQSSHVLVIEHRIPKNPENFILMESYQLEIKALRALQALRLSGHGSVSIGFVWPIRAARFNVGFGGLHRSGFSIPAIGGQWYLWTEDIAQTYPVVYGALSLLESIQYRTAPVNLDVALRAFSGTYDRYPLYPDSQLVDAITALEALIGISTELRFRIAFRVAGLLAESHTERVALLQAMKEFYDTRSAVVHGGRLNAKQRARLQHFEELRGIVRRLLKSFVVFSVSASHRYSKSFFDEKLDITLADSVERQKLRAALGLAQLSC